MNVQLIIFEKYSNFSRSLVAADLAFYKNHVKCMVGLAQIVDNMEEIWDKG